MRRCVKVVITDPTNEAFGLRTENNVLIRAQALYLHEACFMQYILPVVIFLKCAPLPLHINITLLLMIVWRHLIFLRTFVWIYYINGFLFWSPRLHMLCFSWKSLKWRQYALNFSQPVVLISQMDRSKMKMKGITFFEQTFKGLISLQNEHNNNMIKMLGFTQHV